MNIDTLIGWFLGVATTLIAEALFIVWLTREEDKLDEIRS